MNPSRACPRARDAQGRFAKGHSGNPEGRPRGIPNPRRRPLGLLLRQARPGMLVPLVERKPYLLLPLLRLVLPPKVGEPDPGDRLGIDFSRMRNAAEIAEAMGRVVGAVCGGEITPGEGERLARRVRKPLRAIRRLMWREITCLRALRRSEKLGAAKFPAPSSKIPCSEGIPLLVPRRFCRARRDSRAKSAGIGSPPNPLGSRRIEPARRRDYFKPLGPLLNSRSPQWRWLRSRSTTNTRSKKAGFT